MILNFIVCKVGNPPPLNALCGPIDPNFWVVMNENGMTIFPHTVFRQTPRLFKPEIGKDLGYKIENSKKDGNQVYIFNAKIMEAKE